MFHNIGIILNSDGNGNKVSQHLYTSINTYTKAQLITLKNGIIEAPFYFNSVVFDSNNHPYSGSYDFTFKVNNIDFIQYTKSSVSLDHSLFGEMIRIDVEIQEGGTLGNKPLFITKELIYDGDDGWEIENEIRDIIIEMIMTKESDLFNNIRTYDIVELYINYPEE